MFALFEPEETVGRLWHRLGGDAHSYQRHPEAAVAFDTVRDQLGVFFRALGGLPGVRLAAAGAGAPGHRLSLRQRLGMDGEKVPRPRFDGATLHLPAAVDVFPDRDLNASLYEWLAAFFVHASSPPERPADPLAADVAALRTAAAATEAAIAAWPGLRRYHERLAEAVRAIRPRRSLPRWEAAVEAAVKRLLGDPDAAAEQPLWSPLLDDRTPATAFTAPRGYCPFLPVPLWGEVAAPATGSPRLGDPDPDATDSHEGDNQRRAARRTRTDQAQRKDSLMLNRFETVLSLSEMVDVNRKTEDEDEEGARQAAEDLNEMTLGEHDRRPATKLRFDLDLPPEAVATQALDAPLTYPEWDYVRHCYHPNHCRVVACVAAETGENWRADEAARRRIRQVRRQFEALRPQRRLFHAQQDGDDLDLSALVRSVADRAAGGPGSDAVWSTTRAAVRDLSVLVLVDTSLSTDSFIENRRVLDVEKEAVTALSHGLAACGDEHAILAFTSRKRAWVRIETVKEFDEPLSAAVDRRIAGLKPGYYTRIGAAVRHAAACLQKRPNRHRLLLLLSDGKPNDLDHYEGRYGVEDTRVAIREARRLGLKVFGITVDAEARDYFPTLFGRGSYAIFPHIHRLPQALPAIYRHVTR